VAGDRDRRARPGLKKESSGTVAAGSRRALGPEMAAAGHRARMVRSQAARGHDRTSRRAVGLRAAAVPMVARRQECFAESKVYLTPQGDREA
jgi:hypothetical protein